MAMEDMAGMMGSDPEASPGALDDFAAAVQDAFPDETWTPERTEALKTAIKICVEDDQAGEYDEPAPKDKGGLDIAMILGGPPKKKS